MFYGIIYNGDCSPSHEMKPATILSLTQGVIFVHLNPVKLHLIAIQI